MITEAPVQGNIQPALTPGPVVEASVFGNLQNIASQNAAIEARRSLEAEYQQPKKGLGRKIFSGIRRLDRPIDEVKRRESIVKAMTLTNTTFLTWEQAQAALEAVEKTKQDGKRIAKDKTLDATQKRIAQQTLQRVAARSALSATVIEENVEEHEAKKLLWESHLKDTLLGPNHASTIQGETIVNLDNTHPLFDAFRRDVASQLKDIQDHAQGSPEEIAAKVQSAQTILFQEFLKKHRKTELDGKKLDQVIGRSSNKYGDLPSIFTGNVAEPKDSLVMISGSLPVATDTRDIAHKTAALLKKNKITWAPALIGTGAIVLIAAKYAPGAAKKAASLTPAAALPIGAGIGAAAGALKIQAEMEEHKKVVFEELAYAETTPPPQTPQELQSDGAINKIKSAIGSKKQRKEDVRQIYEGLSVPVDDLLSSAPKISYDNCTIAGLESGDMDSVTIWTSEVSARLHQCLAGKPAIQFTRGRTISQQLLLEQKINELHEARAAEENKGNKAKIAAYHADNELQGEVNDRNKAFKELKSREIRKGALIGAGVGTIAAGVVTGSGWLKENIPNPFSDLWTKKTIVPPHLPDKLFPETPALHTESRPVSLDSELTLHGHGTAIDNKVPDYRVVSFSTPDGAADKGLHTFVAADNDIYTNVAPNSKLGRHLDNVAGDLGWKRQELETSPFTINSQLQNRAEAEFNLGSVHWRRIQGNQFQITELDLRPVPEAIRTNYISDHTITASLGEDHGRIYLDVEVLKQQEQLLPRDYDKSIIDVLKADQWILDEDSGRLYAPYKTWQYVPVGKEEIDLNEDKIALLGLAGVAIVAAPVAVTKVGPEVASFVGIKKESHKKTDTVLYTNAQIQKTDPSPTTQLDPTQNVTQTPQAVAKDVIPDKQDLTDEVHKKTIADFLKTLPKKQPIEFSFDQLEHTFSFLNQVFAEHNPYIHDFPLFEILRLSNQTGTTREFYSLGLEIMAKIIHAKKHFEAHPEFEKEVQMVVEKILPDDFDISLEYVPQNDAARMDSTQKMLYLNMAKPPQEIAEELQKFPTIH